METMEKSKEERAKKKVTFLKSSLPPQRRDVLRYSLIKKDFLRYVGIFSTKVTTHEI